MEPKALATIGMALQLCGGAWLVFAAWRTRRKLRGFAERQTWDGQSDSLVDLAAEVSGQFRDQAVGFAALFLGTLLQLLGVWLAP